jgi:hypothetical protein
VRQKPSSYSPRLAAQICARIAAGEAVRAIAQTPGMPASSTIYLWLNTQEDFRLLHAAACEERADALAEEMVAIADDCSGDWKAGGKDGKERVFDRENLARAKLRIETRRWRAARLAPRKYGDRAEATGAGPALMSHEDALAELE